jgi:hypothetical protein
MKTQFGTLGGRAQGRGLESLGQQFRIHRLQSAELQLHAGNALQMSLARLGLNLPQQRERQIHLVHGFLLV